MRFDSDGIETLYSHSSNITALTFRKVEIQEEENKQGKLISQLDIYSLDEDGDTDHADLAEDNEEEGLFPGDDALKEDGDADYAYFNYLFNHPRIFKIQFRLTSV